jgi:hypothetical protein
VPYKLLKQCLCCGHIRITIRPVWPVVVECISSTVLNSLSNSWFMDSCIESRMVDHKFPHSCAAPKHILYNSLFSFSFLCTKI